MILLAATTWPFVVLLLGIIAVVLMISILRFHPFIALLVGAIVVGLLAEDLPIDIGVHPWVNAIELPMKEFGIMAGKIAWVIALAAIIGTAMMESGAAKRIVDWLLAILGERQAGLALLISGFVLSIPVFFDTVFFLLIPLAIALGHQTGKNFVLYVIAIAGGAVITHSLVPPTPGPLIMAETLNVDLGTTIVAGLLAGIIPAGVSLLLGKKLDRQLNIPMRISVSSNKQLTADKLPNLLVAIAPILVPILLISMASIVKVLTGALPAWIAFLGNKNIAMGIGTAIALWVWSRQRDLSKRTLWDAINKPLEIAGIIILITSAGGAFGAMIKHSGIGTAIEAATTNFEISYIILAWLIAAVMKTAQGSSTVAMITTASIMLAIVGNGGNLPYHPIYILLAISFGALFISWMNDSGFWVVARMSGFTEREALGTWTVLLATISLIGLVEVLLMASLFPMK